MTKPYCTVSRENQVYYLLVAYVDYDTRPGTALPTLVFSAFYLAPVFDPMLWRTEAL